MITVTIIEIAAGVAAFVLAIISLYSGICALKTDDRFVFAAEVVVTIMFLAYSIVQGVKVWW